MVSPARTWVMISLMGCTSAPGPPTATQPTPPQQAPALQPAVEPAVEPPVEPAVSVDSAAPFYAGVHGMAVSNDGTLYFSDSFGRIDKTRKIYTLAPPYTGAPVATAITGKTPAGLAWDDGTLLVCDVGDNVVTRYAADFSVVEQWAVRSPWNVARVADTQAWRVVTNDGRVVELGADTNKELFGGLLAPFDLVAVGDAIWVSEQGAARGDPGRVTRRRLDGSIVDDIAYSWANPEGMAMGPDGKLWVVETERGEIIRIDGDGQAEVIRGDLTLPIALTSHPAGDLFFNTGGPSPQLMRVRFLIGAEEPR